MKTTHDADLCGRILKISSANPPMSREGYVKFLNDCGYNTVAIYSALTFLTNHQLLSDWKGLIGVSQTQSYKVALWVEIDEILQATQGGMNASTKGTVQNSSGQS